MGWWKLEAWRFDAEGHETDQLDNVDLEHIADLIKDGYTSGEVMDVETGEDGEDEDMEESCLT